jgi:prophage tail gpP-like protein
MSDLTRTPEVTITLEELGEELYGWQGLQVVRSIDSAADGFAFSLPFDPTPENRERFRPFKATQIRVSADGELLLTGYIEVVVPYTGPDRKTIEIQGRGATGVLIDWSAGPPFEFQGLSFNQIAAQIAHPYELVAQPDTGVLSDVSIEIGSNVYPFISSLAAANGLWAQPQPGGWLRFSRLDSGRASVADLVEGESPVVSVSGNYDVTQRFQKYMVVSQNEGDPDAEYEVSDPELLGANVRGRKIVLLKQQSADLREAANFARSKALIDSFQTTALVTGWKNGTGFWKPGDIIRLKAPGAFIQNLTRLVIKRATMAIDESAGQVTTLDLGLPAAYNQQSPKVEDLPWLG